MSNNNSGNNANTSNGTFSETSSEIDMLTPALNFYIALTSYAFCILANTSFLCLLMCATTYLNGVQGSCIYLYGMVGVVTPLLYYWFVVKKRCTAQTFVLLKVILSTIFLVIYLTLAVIPHPRAGLPVDNGVNNGRYGPLFGQAGLKPPTANWIKDFEHFAGMEKPETLSRRNLRIDMDTKAKVEKVFEKLEEICSGSSKRMEAEIDLANICLSLLTSMDPEYTLGRHPKAGDSSDNSHLRTKADISADDSYVRTNPSVGDAGHAEATHMPVSHGEKTV